MALCPPDSDNCINSGFPGSWRLMTFPCDIIGRAECLYVGKGDYDPNDSRSFTCTPLGMEKDFPHPAMLCQKHVYPWFWDQITLGHSVQYAEDVGTYLRLHRGQGGEVLPATYGLNTSPFESEGTPLFHFLILNPEQPFSPILVEPCVTGGSPCGLDDGQWIGQVKWCGCGEPWDVECLKGLLVTATPDWAEPLPPAGDPQWCRQKPWRSVLIPFATGGMLSVMHTIGKGECFPFNNHYCFTDYCGDESNPSFEDERRFRCMGNFDGEGEHGDDMASAADNLLASWNVRLSVDDTYTKANTFDQHIKNAILEFATGLIDELDKPGHSSYLLVPESHAPFEWKSTELWDHTHEDVLTNGVYPEIPYGTKYPNAPFATAIMPIEGRAWLSGVTYPMELRLISAVTDIEMFHERDHDDDDKSRMFATMTLTVNVEKWLHPGAHSILGPFRFMGDASTPWDLRFRDPDNPQHEHPEERLEVFGPRNERVPSKVIWKGAVLPMPFGRGANMVDACSSWGSGTLPLGSGIQCCNGLQIINKTPLYGQFNDLREEVDDVRWPHLNEGYCHLNVQNLNTGSGGVATACKCLDAPVIPDDN